MYLEQTVLFLKSSNKGLKSYKAKKKKKNHFISCWVVNHIWLDNFAKFCAMFFSNNINKQQRISNRLQNDENEKFRNYFQSRKNESVSKQYIKSYEKYIFTKNLNMNDFKNEKFVFSDSKMICKNFQNIIREIIFSIVYFKVETFEMIKFCRNRNEAMINQNITPLIVPSIKLFYFKDEVNQFKYFINEINTQWYENWILTEFRFKSDLIVNFFFRFHDSRKRKINQLYIFWKFNTINRRFVFSVFDVRGQVWQRRVELCWLTEHAQLQCDGQNVFQIRAKNESVSKKQTVRKLVWQDFCLFYFTRSKKCSFLRALCLDRKKKWTYYRHHNANFDIVYKEMNLLIFHNFARNILTIYASELLKRFQKTIAVLSISFTLLFSADTMSLKNDSQQSFQQFSQSRDAENFTTSVLPVSIQKLFDAQKKQIDKLLQLMEQQKEQMKELKSEKRELLNLLKERFK